MSVQESIPTSAPSEPEPDVRAGSGRSLGLVRLPVKRTPNAIEITSHRAVEEARMEPNGTNRRYAQTGDESESGSTPPVVRVPTLQPRNSEALQEWEGVVESVSETAFLARLADLTEPGAEEATEFDLDEVSPEDLALIEPGAVFYWTIARRTSDAGQRTHESYLTFRRLPAWNARDRQRARERARALLGILDGYGAERSA